MTKKRQVRTRTKTTTTNQDERTNQIVITTVMMGPSVKYFRRFETVVSTLTRKGNDSSKNNQGTKGRFIQVRLTGMKMIVLTLLLVETA